MPKNEESRPPRRGGGMGGPGGGAPAEKPKDFKLATKRLIKELSKYKVLIVISLILAVVSAVISIVAPNKLSAMTDKITEGLIGTMDMNAITKIAITLGIMYVASALFSFIEGIVMTIVSNRFAQRLRGDISRKINKLPLTYFDKNPIGDILSRVTNDVDTIAQTMNQSLGTLVSSITLLIGSVIMMFYTNWIMAITAIGASLLGFVFMFFILKRSQKYFVQRQEELGKLNGHIEEIYSGLNIVKMYNGEKASNEKFDKLNKSVYDANRKSQFLSGLMQPLMQFIGNFGYVAVCVVGALLTSNNYITFGVIVAFITYVRLFTNPLSQIAQSMTSLQSTGAGKTTMVNLLMKFYDIDSGDIKIDGVSTKELTRENVHSLFTMVLQDTWLFEGTIKENIKYNNEDISDEMVENVCKAVGLDHFIKTLPNGYDSKLGENDSVSAGQKQLLTIARGMLQNTPFLILDEATSNVDTRTEELVQNAMDKLAEDKTSFIIAHRLSTIKNADLILVMQNGNIVEQGNHEELMKQNGFYANL